MAREPFPGCRLVWPLIIIVLAFHTQRTSCKYDIIKALFQWPPSYCETPEGNCVPPILERFIIRFLLPIYKDNGLARPVHGAKAPLQLTLDMFSEEEILADMEKYWPSLQGLEKNLEHWQHNEKQFAICFDDFVRPLEYFRLGLDIAKNIDPLAILQENEGIFNITPSNNVYLAALVRKVLIGGLKVNPEIHCSRDKYMNLQLSYIAICFAKHTRKRTDCPNDFYKCPDNISNMDLRFTDVKKQP